MAQDAAIIHSYQVTPTTRKNMKFDVLNRFTGAVNFTAQTDINQDALTSIKLGLAVIWAIENNANLEGANLEGANLEDANLRDANLRSASGLNEYVKCLQLDVYPVVYTSKFMQIGCERHLITDWLDFDDKRILKMDGRSALKSWRKYKEFIFKAIELAPAK